MAAPVLSTITAQARVGQALVLTGVNLDTVTEVHFGSVVETSFTNDSTTIVVDVPSDCPEAPNAVVRVVNPDGISNGKGFTPYFPGPWIEQDYAWAPVVNPVGGGSVIRSSSGRMMGRSSGDMREPNDPDGFETFNHGNATDSLRAYWWTQITVGGTFAQLHQGIEMYDLQYFWETPGSGTRTLQDRQSELLPSNYIFLSEEEYGVPEFPAGSDHVPEFELANNVPGTFGGKYRFEVAPATVSNPITGLDIPKPTAASYRRVPPELYTADIPFTYFGRSYDRVQMDRWLNPSDLVDMEFMGEIDPTDDSAVVRFEVLEEDLDLGHDGVTPLRLVFTTHPTWYEDGPDDYTEHAYFAYQMRVRAWYQPSRYRWYFANPSGKLSVRADGETRRIGCGGPAPGPIWLASKDYTVPTAAGVRSITFDSPITLVPGIDYWFVLEGIAPNAQAQGHFDGFVSTGVTVTEDARYGDSNGFPDTSNLWSPLTLIADPGPDASFLYPGAPDNYWSPVDSATPFQVTDPITVSGVSTYWGGNAGLSGRWGIARRLTPRAGKFRGFFDGQIWQEVCEHSTDPTTGGSAGWAWIDPPVAGSSDFVVSWDTPGTFDPYEEIYINYDVYDSGGYVSTGSSGVPGGMSYTGTFDFGAHLSAGQFVTSVSLDYFPPTGTETGVLTWGVPVIPEKRQFRIELPYDQAVEVCMSPV